MDMNREAGMFGPVKRERKPYRFFKIPPIGWVEFEDDRIGKTVQRGGLASAHWSARRGRRNLVYPGARRGTGNRDRPDGDKARPGERRTGPILGDDCRPAGSVHGCEPQ